jgi:hypothetical protein
MAEASELVRGLASPAKALRKEITNLYQSLQKRAYRSARRGGRDMAKVVGGTWLEWKFAVDPLISDCDDAATAFNKVSQGDFRHSIPIRGRGIDYLETYQGWQAVAVPGIPTGLQCICHREDRCSVINRASIRISSDNGEVPLAMQFGVGVEDLLPSVYEGIPWSWFVDYFTNVSSVIQAYSIIAGNISWANRTVRNSRTQFWGPAQAVPSGVTPSRFEYTCLRSGLAEAEFSTVTRTKAQLVDLLPPLRAKVPFSGVKWCNLAALSTMFRPPYKRVPRRNLDGRSAGSRRGIEGNWEYVTLPPPRKR